MSTPAPAAHPIHELIAARSSPRIFSDRPVAPDVLAAIFEAARWAPSSYNEQPWSFVFAPHSDKEAFGRIFDCLVPGNQTWAHTAAVLMISVAHMTFAANCKPNRHAFHDVGLASGSMALQAAALGLGIHMMSGFGVAKAREVLGIPDGFEPVAAIALGYPEHPDKMAPEHRERVLKPRTRKPIGEFAFAGNWGRGATGLD